MIMLLHDRTCIFCAVPAGRLAFSFGRQRTGWTGTVLNAGSWGIKKWTRCLNNPKQIQTDLKSLFHTCSILYCLWNCDGCGMTDLVESTWSWFDNVWPRGTSTRTIRLKFGYIWIYRNWITWIIRPSNWTRPCWYRALLLL